MVILKENMAIYYFPTKLALWVLCGVSVISLVLVSTVVHNKKAVKVVLLYFSVSGVSRLSKNFCRHKHVY